MRVLQFDALSSQSLYILSIGLFLGQKELLFGEDLALKFLILWLYNCMLL